MGCLKLTYYESETALSENRNIFERGIGKSVRSKKTGLNYYTGGSIMPGRSFNSTDYRYGAFGHEKDDEVKGSGNHLSFMDNGYDTRLIRRWNVDPKFAEYPHISPYSAFEGNPIYFNDDSGENAEITINGNQITVSTKIYIYGSGATAEKVAEMQTNIMAKWGGDHSYKDPETGQVYNVKFDIKVGVYQGNSPSTNIVEIKSQPQNNFVEVSDEAGRSHVDGERRERVNTLGGRLITRNAMQTGTFYTKDRVGRESEASAHETGHLLGLSDRYRNIRDSNGLVIGGESFEGWENNIMGSADGVVDQRNINGIVGNAVKAYNDSYTKAWNDCDYCPSTFDFNYTQTNKDHEPRVDNE